ncbi:GNAT family N-acetyltransferase [Herbaspirillum rubrisubalbicans]|uniref:N-acetyltransferase n=1 Tax=Herbaspirillum rubrisubalbicans TaxID=80842 RepID=A0AAD0U985_9BURK|nr:GNAT family N-acetyltransferase [Herbaspirillum rubrisubalbicans]AYR24586.1 N-acetyltransferase [Herbaspirillum rubrisubalbicans]
MVTQHHSTAAPDAACHATPTAHVPALRLATLPSLSGLYCQPVSPASRPAPPLVRAWVDAIVQFWCLQREAGVLDPREPLHIIDPAPANGALAMQVLQALDDLSSFGLGDWRVCYVACAPQTGALGWRNDHPWLAPFFQRGSLDLGLLHDRGAGLSLQQRGVTLLHLANPVVILGWQWFGSLGCELVGADQGQLWTPDIMVDDGDGSLDYAWQKADPDVAQQHPYPHLLQDCLDNMAGVPVPIPTAACEELDRLTGLSSRRYLLLATDHGVGTARQLRAHLPTLPRSWPPAHGRLPVNYHSLALHQRRYGANTWQHQLSDGGMVLHLACRLPDSVPLGALLDAVAAPLAAAHPDLAAQLVALAGTNQSLTQTALLHLLTISGHDPAVLQAGLSAGVAQDAALDSSGVPSWQAALRQTWHHYVPDILDDGFTHAFGTLAANLGDWALARACLQDGMLLHGPSVRGLHQLARCHAATGQRERALPLLDLALDMAPAAAPDDADSLAHCRSLRDQLPHRQQAILTTAWFDQDIASDGELTLEPLGPEHADSLLHQYRDAQIGVMTRLPELDSVADARDWIARHTSSDARQCCAVIHDSWGFIGVVSLHRGEQAGYFYFWIGCDFQDRGWGQQAARLFIAQAVRNGLTALFTAAYRDNHRSRKALQRLGFRHMALRAAAPDDDLLFYRLPLSDDVTACRDGQAEDGHDTQQFRQLCASIDYRIELEDQSETSVHD